MTYKRSSNSIGGGFCLAILILLIPHLIPAQTADLSEVLKPWKENPWYWSYHDQPILLLGGSDDDNLFQWPADKLDPHLDRLVTAGGNVIRNTMSDRRDKGFEIYAYKELETGKYDLDQWNPEYWNRFTHLLSATHERGIFIQIELWDRFDFTDQGGKNHWQRHPYNPKNNINYTDKESGYSKAYPDHPGANKQPFFFSTPRQRNNRTVLKYQKKFIDRILNHSLKYDHVMYCMDNETKAEDLWGLYWAQLVKERAEQSGKIVPITEMWDDWNLRAERHKQTFDHPDIYSFVDVSQNNHNKGESHWDNFLYVRDYLSTSPRPMNTTKTYGATGNKFRHTDQDGIERFWRHLLAGVASMRFHRPDSGLGLNDKAVACLKAARKLESMIPLWKLKPDNGVLVGRQPNQAFAAISQREAAVVYFPRKSTVEIDLNRLDLPIKAVWINIDIGSWGETFTLKDSGISRLSPPLSGNTALILKAVEL